MLQRNSGKELHAVSEIYATGSAGVLQHVDEFKPAELALVANAHAGSTTTLTTAGIA